MAALILPAILSPILASLLMLLAFDVRKQPAISALVFGLCFAATFYGLRLDSSNDIYRHIALLAEYGRADFFHCFGAGHYDMLFVWDIWSWIIAKIGDPYLFQSSAAFIGYSIIAFVIFDFSARINASRYVVALSLFQTISAIPFLWIVCGIRSSIALLVCAIAAYLHFTNRLPFLCLLMLMIVGSLIHPIALIAAILILVGNAIACNPFKMVVVVFVVMLFSAAIGTWILPHVSSSGNPILSFIASALEAFLGYHEGNEWTAEQSSSLNTRVNLLFTVLWIAVLVVNCIYASRTKRVFATWIMSPLDALTLAFAATTVALSIVLESNGTRLIPILFLLGQTSIIARMTEQSPTDSKPLFYFDCLSTGIAAALFALHAYSIAYGIVEPESFIGSIFFGILMGVW